MGERGQGRAAAACSLKRIWLGVGRYGWVTLGKLPPFSGLHLPPRYISEPLPALVLALVTCGRSSAGV